MPGPWRTMQLRRTWPRRSGNAGSAPPLKEAPSTFNKAPGALKRLAAMARCSGGEGLRTCGVEHAPRSFPVSPLMALHIRDCRHINASGLSQLCERAHHIGAPPAQDAGAHILVGLREGALTGAIWLTLKGESGMLTAVLVEQSAGWQSIARELVAEACPWLTSRGAARIDLQALPEDTDLRAGLLDMDFRANAAAETMRRLVRSHNAA